MATSCAYFSGRTDVDYYSTGRPEREEKKKSRSFSFRTAEIHLF